MTPNIILSAFLEVGLRSRGQTDRGQAGRRRQHWDGGPEGGSRRGAEDRLAVAGGRPGPSGPASPEPLAFFSAHDPHPPAPRPEVSKVNEKFHP